MAKIEVLDRPLYSVWEAAFLLRISSQTLRRWLEGWTHRGVEYLPVIREESTGSEAVTWGEFVEAGFLRGYRVKRVPLQKMRPFIVRTRHEFGIPYPLAHFKPLINNRRLVYELQGETGLDPALFLIEADGDQFFWAEPVREFLEKVDFSPDDVVIRLHPMGKKSPVAIDPDVSFGIPQIRGIRTEKIAESVTAGGIREASEAWEVNPTEIDAALAWESTRLKAA